MALRREVGRIAPQTEFQASPSQIKSLLARHGFTLKKQLGQNFLVDPVILEQIVAAAELTAEDGVFEIGPGAGVVTRQAAETAKKVLAVEKDTTLRGVLEDWLRGLTNVQVVYGDVLKVDLAELWSQFQDCRQVSVIANLPYYITTPILFQLLDAKLPIRNFVVMVQKEVADRLTASPGGKDYGALTIAVQYRTQVEPVLQVGPEAFVPPPSVDSTVVRMRVLAAPPVQVQDERFFFRVIKAAFATRRKTLLNALSSQLGLRKDQVQQALATAGIDSIRRGETLSIQEFATLAQSLRHLPGSEHT